MVEKLPIPVAETIRKRRSVRTYEERPLSPEDRAKLVGYMGAVGNPFGVEVRLHIADRSVAAGGETLGTYGIIKGAGTFLGVSIPDTEPAALAAGYQFECLVLCATDMGLGTVWLAATFDRPRFASAGRVLFSVTTFSCRLSFSSCALRPCSKVTPKHILRSSAAGT